MLPFNYLSLQLLNALEKMFVY